ncbi:hypothetical protein ACFSTA_18535 [Ornithinibacillus salinisoli]|uniref:Uncharacterized protein n=1 Tax=Ornithinibacillus salinisoli TaxID=1848459 RepID=A0ABW4W1J6_9BACI
MDKLTRIVSLIIFVFLLNVLFGAKEVPDWMIMIASLSAFILYFLSLYYEKRNKKETS